MKELRLKEKININPLTHGALQINCLVSDDRNIGRQKDY